MEFRILGPLEVVDGERPVPLGGAKQRALLAALLLRAGEVVSTDRLIDDLWVDAAPPTARQTVQVYVSHLRKALGDGMLKTRGRGYVLDVVPDHLDSKHFEELLGRGRDALAEGRAEEAAQLLREALALWRGPPLSDLAYEAFAQAEIARLDERKIVCLEERIEADLALGRHGDLVGELESLVAAYPLRERFRAQLMLALYRSGRQAEALEAYQSARRSFAEEVGLEPSPLLKELERKILSQDPELALPRVTAPGGQRSSASGRGSSRPRASCWRAGSRSRSPSCSAAARRASRASPGTPLVRSTLRRTRSSRRFQSAPRQGRSRSARAPFGCSTLTIERSLASIRRRRPCGPSPPGPRRPI